VVSEFCFVLKVTWSSSQEAYSVGDEGCASVGCRRLALDVSLTLTINELNVRYIRVMTRIFNILRFLMNMRCQYLGGVGTLGPVSQT